MTTVRLDANGFGGVINGNFGTYVVGSDGTVTVDTRDVPSMLVLGMTYVWSALRSYSPPIPPAAAAVGRVVASGALSNGTVAISNQPDVMRPVTVEVGTGTGAITAGTVTMTYVGNDGQTHVDVFSTVINASAAVTYTTSYGVVTVSSIVTAGVTGGVSPWLRSSTTTAISLPLGSNNDDVTVLREYDAGATIAIGTPGVSIGSIVPTTAANGTVTYSFLLGTVSGDV